MSSKNKEFTNFPERRQRGTGRLLGKLGPILVKYLQNCWAICARSESSWLPDLNTIGKFCFEDFLFKISLSNLQVILMLGFKKDV